MKKEFLLMCATIMTLAIMSCGGSKTTTQTTNPQSSQSNAYGIAVEQDICEKMQEDKPALRAVGNAKHFNLSAAKNIAEAQARGNFAKALSAKITTATSAYAGGRALYSGDDETGGSITDQSTKEQDFVKSIAETIVANTVAIKWSTYQLPNKQFNVFVCLEYQGDVSIIAAETAKNFSERLTNDQKLRIDFDEMKFKQEIEKELNSLKGQ